MNAKEEFIRTINPENVLCATIEYGDVKTKDLIINLPVGYTAEELKGFLESLDFEYYEGYRQELFGTIWAKDGTWYTRREYNGSKWWEHHVRPEIPEKLDPLVQKLKQEMVFVEGGTFKYGNRDVVTISNFFIGKYPVTQELWNLVMETNPSHFPGNNLPVENIDLQDIKKFFSKLNQKTGLQYYLPIVEEWEYAARGGNQSKGYKYAGSNNLEEIAWYKNNAENKTHPVGCKIPNELGLYDMNGNVWEVCMPYKYDPHLSIRGGSIDSDAKSCEIINRYGVERFRTEEYYGFRIALYQEPRVFPIYRNDEEQKAMGFPV